MIPLFPVFGRLLNRVIQAVSIYDLCLRTFWGLPESTACFNQPGFYERGGIGSETQDLDVTLEVLQITEYQQRTTYADSGVCGVADIKFSLRM